MNPSSHAASPRSPKTPGKDAPPLTSLGQVAEFLSTHRIALFSAALFLAVLAVFWQAGSFGFLSFDDNQYIPEIPAVREGLTASSFWWAWTNSHVGQWHPLTTLSFIFDSTVSGFAKALATGKSMEEAYKAAGWFHFHNIILHGAAAALLFLAINRLTRSFWRSAFAAAIFALHPLRAESVAWVTERKDVLSGAFLMAILWSYAYYTEKPSSRKRHVLLCVLFALGLLSKPMLVTIPFVMVLLDIWPLKRLNIEPESPGGWKGVWKQLVPLLREKTPLFVMAFASAIGAVFAVGTPFRPIPILPLLPRLLYIPVSYVMYLRQFFLPYGLSAHYPFVVEGPPIWKALLCAAILVALSVLAWRWRKQHPSFLLGWFWFLGALLPVIGLVPGGIQIAADRYTYVPQIGMGIAAAWMLGSLVRALPAMRNLVCAAAVLVVGVFSIACVKQTATWKDDESLWTHSLKVTQNNDYSSEKLASAYQARALREPAEKAQELRKDAEKLFRDAVRLNPHLVGSLNNLSVLLRGKGELPEAIELQRKAAEEHPRWGLMHRNLASVLTQNRQFPEAVTSFEKAISLDANDVESRYNLGLILSETRTDAESLQAALEQFRKAVALQPRFAEAHFSMGNVLYRQGKVDEAILSFRKAIEMDPNHARACNNLASLLGTKGDKEEPSRLYQRAIQIDGNYLEAYRNLAEALLRNGNPAGATQVWQAALARNPNDLPSIYRLSWILATHPDAGVRKIYEPIDLAKKGVELTQGKEPAFLDALAAAQAQLGKFSESRELVGRALDLIPDKNSPQAAALKARMELYKEEKAYREPIPGT
jgi:tetratricopeptide (TPR) repeat protein